MAKTPYDVDLDRSPANYQPLTPLGFLERAAAVFPNHTAIIHGPLRRSYREFYARSRRLASALSRRGIKRGDTVSALLANTPAMLECHYGVPMSGAVLNTINTRLDAAVVAFQLTTDEDLITDREFAPAAKALGESEGKAAVIDYNDRSSAACPPLRERLRGFLAAGDPARWRCRGRVGRDHAQLHLGHDRNPKRRLPTAAPP
jgi:fatty-acyl-CoA synthase